MPNGFVNFMTGASLLTFATGYIIAAVLNFSDITSAWQMMLIYSAVVIIYAFLRERYLKKKG